MEQAPDAEDAVLARAMAVFENPEAPDEIVWGHFETILPIVARQTAGELKTAFEWWMRIYLSTRLACTREEIKGFIRESVASEAYFVQARYPVVGGAMKAAVHCMWRRLYVIMTKNGGDRVRLGEECSVLQKSKQFYCELLDELVDVGCEEVVDSEVDVSRVEMPSRGVNNMIAMRYLLRKYSPRS